MPAGLVLYGFATNNWNLILGGPVTTGLGHYVLGHPWRGLGFAAGAYAIPLGAGVTAFNVVDAGVGVSPQDALGPGLNVGIAAGMLVFGWAAWDAYQLAEQARRERLRWGGAEPPASALK